MSKRVVRPLSKRAIWFASRIPKRTPSSVTVSLTRSARAWASVMGRTSAWCAIYIYIYIECLEPVLDADRGESRRGPPGRVALHVHGYGVHGDVGRGDLDVYRESGGVPAQALGAHAERV